MSTLAEQLQAIRAGAAKRIPPEKRAIMERATEDLRGSGILEQVIRAGDPLPPMSLRNARGELIETGSLLGRGPVLLTVFRGSW
jgi:hypothetical protein